MKMINSKKMFKVTLLPCVITLLMGCQETKKEYVFEVEQTEPAGFLGFKALTVELINRGPSDCVDPIVYFNDYYRAPLSVTKSGWISGYKSNASTIPMGQQVTIGFGNSVKNPFTDDQGRTLDWNSIKNMKIVCNDGEWNTYSM